MLRGGGRVVTGTDSPIAITAVSTHMNLRAMVIYGLSPYEALRPVPSHPGNRRYWWHHPRYVQESRHACCTQA
jgi:hypothetical protein